VQVSAGTVRQHTDFLYLLSTKEEGENVPKRLRDVSMEKALNLQKKGLSDNCATASLELSIPKGSYKLYYLRIEDERRIISTSRLEVLG